MLGNIAIGTMIAVEVGMTAYSMNRFGLFDKAKTSITNYKNKVHTEYCKGRYPDEYKAFMKQHGQMVTT